MADSTHREGPGSLHVGNAGIVGWCIILLLTIIIPWAVVENRPVWSWVFLEQSPEALETFVIAEWIIAGVLMVLAGFLRGFPFSFISLAGGVVGVVLMVQVFSKGFASIAMVDKELFEEITTSGLPIEVIAILSVLAMYVFTSLRKRIGPGPQINFLEGGAAVASVALMLVIFVPQVKEFAELVDRSSLRDVLVGPGSILGAGLLAQVFVLLAGLLAFINALAVRGEASLYSRTAIGLVHAALCIILAVLIVLPGIQMQSPLASLAIAINIVLFVTMPVLVIMGAIRLIGDVAVAAKKTLRPSEGKAES